jgi:phage/plasmid-associated DNA primase
MNKDKDFYLYELQCIKYHQETYGHQSWHWTQIPENVLYESGFIHNGNEYRLKRKLKWEENQEYFNPLQEYGLDGIALEMCEDKKIYHGIQCKLWNNNKLSGNDLGTFFISIFARLNKKNNESRGFLYYSGELEDNLKNDLEQIPYYIFKIQLDYNNKNNLFEFEHTDICKYLKNTVGDNFIYKLTNDKLKLYCYNGKYWEKDDIIFKKYLSNELYDYYKKYITDFFWDKYNFQNLKNKIDKLKTLSYKKEIVETYKEFGTNNNINFDDKWNLFGFTNVVYDLEKGEFREYKYDDYVSITCGYKWREPTQEEIENVENLINSIMPIKEERELLLQILCTGLDGKCLEKFVIFNAGGGNGKGVINDLMLVALGNYGMLGNNGILFEYSKTGSNPEKANIHKKRYVVFREPPEKNKFENSIIKELTGGGIFSARSHHEKTAEKELNLTMVVECNKRPLFAEEPKESETRRIIDILFRSTFTSDESAIDEEKFIFIANPDYKSKIFQEKHKFALLKILFDTYKTYLKNKCILQVPLSIKERTQQYLELSCCILPWFKENYEKTNDKEFIKIKDIYENFLTSNFFNNLSKQEKKKYNKTFFNEYFETNIFLRGFYAERYNNIRSVIRGWKPRANDEEL